MRAFLPVVLAFTVFVAIGAAPAVGEAGKKKPAAKARRVSREIPDLTKRGEPNIQAKSALIIDMDVGTELFAKNPDEVRQIASVGKLFLAMVVRERGLELDGRTTMTEEDRKLAIGGARSRLPVGKTFSNHDLLRAMLISSDNRACSALGRATGLNPERLVAAMNAKARALGLTRTRFFDPTGLQGNVSTTRELAIALRAALLDPVIAEVLATPQAVVRSFDKNPVEIEYTTTDLALRGKRYDVLGGKTGFNEEAGYCLAIAARLNGKRVAMVFLGEEEKDTRFGDFHRGAQWYMSRAGGASGATAAPSP